MRTTVWVQPTGNAPTLRCLWQTIPCGPYEALMQHGEPRRSRLESEADWDRLHDALEDLDERTRWIVERCVYERLSIRAIAAQVDLSKSYVCRLKQAGLKKLADALV